MANQTITTTVNYDDASIGGLLDGETISIQGGSLTIDADTRWNQQAAVFGSITLSSTLGGSISIDGTQVWEVPFSSSTGNVPTQAALGSNGVTGGTSGATGELTRVWDTESFNPSAAGGAMPATGYIKLRSKTGNFQAGETITLPGGATIVATNAGKRSWIHVIGRSANTLTINRLNSATFTGDWYELGLTDGSDNQSFTLPFKQEIGGIQIETAPNSGIYEWWANAGGSWNGIFNTSDGTQVVGGMAAPTPNAIAGPANYPPGTLFRENTTTGTHQIAGASLTPDAGAYEFTAHVKQETRQWCVVQLAANNGTDRYGVLVDLAAGTIIATPTVGSPTGTSSSITSLGNGWYSVTVSINHSVSGTGTVIPYVAWADSATPTYTTGLPTYTGNAAQGGYIGYQGVRQLAAAYFSTTDARGKFFFCDPIAGTIQIAKRGTYGAGLKPASGCKIRMPNIILGTAHPVDYAGIILSFANRYIINAANANFTMSLVAQNWTANFAPSSCSVQNITSTLAFQLAGNSVTADNVVYAPSLWFFNGSLPIAHTVANLSITNSRFVGIGGFQNNIAVIGTTNGTFTDVMFERIQTLYGRVVRNFAQTSGFNSSIQNGTFTRCSFINTTLIGTYRNAKFIDTRYADTMFGINSGSTNGFFLNVSAGGDIVIDGWQSFAGLPNIHPPQGLVYGLNFIGLEIKNIGTPSALYDCGSVNRMNNLIVGSWTNVTMRRVYLSNLQSVPNNALGAGSKTYDVWVTGSTSVTLGSYEWTLSRGCYWTNSRTGIAGCQGTHWDDAYNSSTTGRITIMCNEPTTNTASQCVSTFGVGSGFTGSGSIILSKLTDLVTWTAPLKFYGHNAFAGGCAVSGANCQNLLFEYKIDTGSGFGSSWAFLANTVRSASGGTSGTNTVTVNSTDHTALARQPQIGDFVQANNFALPANTTITNIVGNVITCSNNFTANVGGFLTFSPVNVAVTAANGYALQVQTYPTTAAVTTSLTAFTMGIQTDATAQQIPHPFPGSLVNISNLIPQSRVKVRRADTGALLQQASCGAGTTLNFDFQYTGFVTVEARNASSTPAYKPWVTQVSISPTATTNVVALQESD